MFATSAKQNTNIDKGIKELISAIMLLDDHRVTDADKEETTGDTIVLRHREKPHNQWNLGVVVKLSFYL